MNLFWLIYLIGFGVALFYTSFQFIRWCEKHRIDYRNQFRDVNTLLMIILESFGSWITVIFKYVTRDKD